MGLEVRLGMNRGRVIWCHVFARHGCSRKRSNPCCKGFARQPLAMPPRNVRIAKPNKQLETFRAQPPPPPKRNVVSVQHTAHFHAPQSNHSRINVGWVRTHRTLTPTTIPEYRVNKDQTQTLERSGSLDRVVRTVINIEKPACDAASELK